MIDYYKKGLRDLSLRKLEKFEFGSWVHVTNPTKKEIDFLTDKFKLNKDDLADGLDIYENPRIEQEGENIYIFIRVPTERIEQETTSAFLIILADDTLITVSKFPLAIFDKIIESNINFITIQKSKFLLKLLSIVSRMYEVSVRNILKEVKASRRQLSRFDNKDIMNLVLNEDKLNDYLSSFSPLIDMYNRILKIKFIKFYKQDKELIEDLIIDLNQTLKTCEFSLKSISNMRDYYSTTLSSNINTIITILTVFTVFLTIPTVISSIYGMNVPLPLQHFQGFFWLFLFLVLLIWGILFLVLRRKKIV